MSRSKRMVGELVSRASTRAPVSTKASKATHGVVRRARTSIVCLRCLESISRISCQSEPHPWIHVRSVNCAMASRRPTRALPEVGGVFFLADEDSSIASHRLDLRVAFEAQIWITLGEQFAIDRAVRLMTDHAPLAHRLVFKGEGTRLFAMT